jgi:hypothetical protein
MIIRKVFIKTKYRDGLLCSVKSKHLIDGFYLFGFIPLYITKTEQQLR